MSSVSLDNSLFSIVWTIILATFYNVMYITVFVCSYQYIIYSILII